MKGLDKVIWSNIYTAINAEGKEKLINIIKQDNMFDWSRIGKGSWSTVLQTYPEAADKCPWSELRLDIMVDISLFCGDRFESLYKYDKVEEYNICRQVKECNDPIREEILLRLLKVCGFSKMCLPSLIHDIAKKKKFGTLMFKKLTKEQIELLDKDQWMSILRDNPELMKYTPVEIFKKYTKSALYYLIAERPLLASKCIPIEIMCQKVSLMHWGELGKMVPGFMSKLDAKKLKGYNARSFIEKNPTVLMTHNMLDFGMSITDWKRMLKSKPDIVKYLPADYEHSLVVLALKKKTK